MSCCHRPKTFLGKNQPWVTAKIIDLCNRIRKLRHGQHTSQESRTEFQKANTGVRKKMKEAKEVWIQKQSIDNDTELTTCSF